MTTKEVSIDITPHKQTMRALKYSGYSTTEAISELIDNAIDARFDNEQQNIVIEITPEHIIVRDNGKAMNETGLGNSVRLGFSEKIGKVGKFGLGLKTAALSLGDKFIIRTKPAGDDKVYSLSWDQRRWEESYLVRNDLKWTHTVSVSEGANREEHWTEVKISNLRIRYYPNLPSIIRTLIGERFAGFINTGDVIIVNGKKTESNQVDFVDLNFPLFKKEGLSGNVNIDFVVEDKSENKRENRKVTGWLRLMPSRRPGKGNFGFSTFQNGRLIAQHEKIGFTPHATHANLYGELNLEGFAVTHNKREFLKDNDLFAEMEKKLKETILPVLRAAEKFSKKEYEIWLEGGEEGYTIFKADSDEGYKRWKSGGMEAYLRWKERKVADEEHAGGDASDVEPEQSNSPDMSAQLKKVTARGINAEVVIMSSSDNRLWSAKKTDAGITVEVNELLTSTSDLNFLRKLCIAEAIAEELLKKGDTRGFRIIRDEILKEL